MIDLKSKLLVLAAIFLSVALVWIGIVLFSRTQPVEAKPPLPEPPSEDLKSLGYVAGEMGDAIRKAVAESNNEETSSAT